jgi:hypothetical protein
MYLLSFRNQLLFITESFDPSSETTTCYYPLYKEEVVVPTKDLHVVNADYKPKVMELQPKWMDLIHQRELIVADAHVKRKRSYAKKSSPKKKTLQQLILESSEEELPELLEKHGYGSKLKED